MTCNNYVVFDCCNVYCVDVFLFFFRKCCCTASCGTSSIFMSQMAVGFSNAIRINFSLGVFIINTRNPVFHPFVLFQAMCSRSVWFTWLKCSNNFALLLQCNHCLEMFLCLVSQAFTTMLAKRGTVFVRGCIGYHFDGLLSQLLDAVHPLVLFTAM